MPTTKILLDAKVTLFGSDKAIVNEVNDKGAFNIKNDKGVVFETNDPKSVKPE